MATAAPRLTAEDCYRLQHADPDVHGYELVDGELVEVTPANFPHGRIIATLSHKLMSHVDEYGGGTVCADVGFVLTVPGDAERVRGPDIAFVSDQTLEEAGGEPAKGFARMVPELAVEIHSPSNEREAQDFVRKIRDYLDAGVQLVWVLYPEARYAVAYHPDGSARLLRETEALGGEDVLPGFRLPLTDLLDG